MNLSTEVLIPYGGDDPHRARALAWVLGQYEREHPDWRVTVAAAPQQGEWSKGAVAMPAVDASDAVVIVLADADVWCEQTGAAAAAVAEVDAHWAVPHSNVHRLTELATTAVLAGEPWKRQSLSERPYRGREGGGIVIARREVLLESPLDPRFLGWSREDQSLGMALWTLHGPCWRSSGPLVHLWHPPQERTSRKRGSAATEQLFRRYVNARRDHAAMRALLQEARDALSTAQPPHHDHTHAVVH